MCHHCGCRQIPLIRDYIAEHEHVLDLGERALAEMGRGALDAWHRAHPGRQLIQDRG